MKLFGFTLPIAYEKDVVREEEEANREYTEKQAMKVAKRNGRKRTKEKIG